MDVKIAIDRALPHGMPQRQARRIRRYARIKNRALLRALLPLKGRKIDAELKEDVFRVVIQVEDAVAVRHGHLLGSEQDEFVGWRLSNKTLAQSLT